MQYQKPFTVGEAVRIAEDNRGPFAGQWGVVNRVLDIKGGVGRALYSRIEVLFVLPNGARKFGVFEASELFKGEPCSK